MFAKTAFFKRIEARVFLSAFKGAFKIKNDVFIIGIVTALIPTLFATILLRREKYFLTIWLQVALIFYGIAIPSFL
ncbi:hypothetical protein, partial [Bacillus sp. JJ1764]|uniref:hypothetical protein n=1 Tax=Bacillus sp. JJ1764 TaxID=3122964 RepID=UPI002FFFD45D